MLHWRAVPPAEWHGPDLAYLGKKRRITWIKKKNIFTNILYYTIILSYIIIILKR